MARLGKQLTAPINAPASPVSAKKFAIRIDAPHSRQPLVKGERLVRYEVNAVMSHLWWHAGFLQA